MSKRGDAYLRTLLIHGPRSVIYRVTQRADRDSWIYQVTARRNKNVAAVALANKKDSSDRLGCPGSRARVPGRLRSRRAAA